MFHDFSILQQGPSTFLSFRFLSVVSRRSKVHCSESRQWSRGPGFNPRSSQAKNFLKLYLIPPYITLSNIRYVSTPRCSSNWKGSLLVALDYGCQLYLSITTSARLDKIRGSSCIPKSQKRLCDWLSKIYCGLCIYHLYIWSNFSFWHNL